MTISPELAAVITALLAVVGLYYRTLLKQIEEEKAEAEYWREKALASIGLSEIATEQAERKRR